MEKLKFIVIVIAFILCSAASEAFSGNVSILIQNKVSSGTLSGNDFSITDSTGNSTKLSGSYNIQQNGLDIYVAGAVMTLPAVVESTAPLSWNGTPYRGSLKIQSSQLNFAVINTVDVESYIKGVVRSEMSPSWHIEALKAQAVVARTYTASAIGKHGDFDLCATTHCQVYKGMKAETANINEAVTETSGKILTWNGRPASVFYHTDSGGMVTASSMVWGSDIPYLTVKAEPIQYSGPNTNWQCSISMSEIENKLASGGINVGSISSLTPITRDESQRVLSLEIVGSVGRLNISGHRFRSLVGSDKIRSTMFEFDGVGVPVAQITVPAQAKADSRTTLQSKKKSPMKIDKSKMPSGSEDKLVWLTKHNVFSTRELMEMLSRPDKIDYYVKVGMARIDGRSLAPESSELRPAPVVIPSVSAVLNKMSNNSAAGDIVTIQGRGWGHGVGLSQWGAKTLAENGWLYADILAHYFPGTVLGE